MFFRVNSQQAPQNSRFVDPSFHSYLWLLWMHFFLISETTVFILLLNQLCYCCAFPVLQSWGAKMWRISSQLSSAPAPTNHLHHHRCLTPRVQGPFPPHLALECLIPTQVPLYTLERTLNIDLLALWTFSKLFFLIPTKETPCFHGCR